MADISFLEQIYQVRQESSVRYLADLHEPDSWDVGENDERRA